MIPIAATANAARRASSSFFSEGVGKWKMIHPAHEGKHSKSGEALDLNLDLNNLRALFDNSCVAASKESDQFLFLLGAIMNRFVVTAKAAYPLFMLDPPYPAVAIEIEMVWHQNADGDHTIRWLLNELVASVGDLQ